MYVLLAFPTIIFHVVMNYITVSIGKFKKRKKHFNINFMLLCFSWNLKKPNCQIENYWLSKIQRIKKFQHTMFTLKCQHLSFLAFQRSVFVARLIRGIHRFFFSLSFSFYFCFLPVKTNVSKSKIQNKSVNQKSGVC